MAARSAAASSSVFANEPAPLCCSKRIMVTISCFMLAVVNVFLRNNLHFAVVCFSADLNKEEEAKHRLFEVCNTTENGAKIFNIPKDLSGHMNASFFYGLVLSLILGGVISDKIGARKPFIIGTSVQILCTFFSPLTLNFFPYLFFPNRVIQGFFAGMASSPMYQLFSKWAPPAERAKLIGFGYLGYPVAGIAIYPLTGLMCAYGFRGWESAFYLPGVIGLVSLILFHFYVHDSPDKSPNITLEEKMYLANCISQEAHSAHTKKHSTPWMSILTSGPVYAYVLSHAAQVFNWQMVTINIPAFFKEVLHFEIGENAFMSSLPFISLLIIRVTVALTFDYFLRCSKLSITRFRKNNHIVGTLTPATCLLIMSFLSAEYRYVSIVLLTVGQGSTDFATNGGYYPTFLDMAPNFSGSLLGFADSVAFSGSIISSLVVGYTTTNATKEEWNYILYAQACFLIFAAIIYEIFGSSELQPWARNRMSGTEFQEFEEIKTFVSQASRLAIKI